MKRRIAFLMIFALPVFGAEYYVDGVNGDDGDAGTSGAAKATIAAGIGLMSAGDTLYIANTGTYTLSSALDLTGITTAQTTPLVFDGSWRGENSDGTDSITAPVTTYAAHIDGNDAVASIWTVDSANQYCTFRNLKMGNTTGDLTSGAMNYTTLFRCHVYDLADDLWGANSVRCKLIECYFEDIVDVIYTATAGLTYHCTFDTCGKLFAGTDSVVIGNIFRAMTGTQVIYCSSYNSAFIGNSFSDNTVANQDAIYVAGASAIVFQNSFANQSGSGAYAIDGNTNAELSLVGNNAFYNCTGTYGTSPAKWGDLTAEDVTESSASQFTDPSTGDWTIKSTADSYQAGWQGFLGTTTDINNSPGAVQDAGGGGSSSTPISISIE